MESFSLKTAYCSNGFQNTISRGNGWIFNLFLGSRADFDKFFEFAKNQIEFSFFIDFLLIFIALKMQIFIKFLKDLYRDKVKKSESVLE